MKKNHINYYVKASVKEQLEIDDFAVLTVLNNMIDNALEAALQSKKKAFMLTYASSQKQII